MMGYGLAGGIDYVAGWFGMVLIMVLMVVIPAGFILFIALALGWPWHAAARQGHPGYGMAGRRSPEDIARERYALGECSKEEYLDIMECLTSEAPEPSEPGSPPRSGE